MGLNKTIKIMAVLIMLAILTTASIFSIREAVLTANIPIETKKALEYGELEDKDYKTQSENIEFSVFFTKDLNGDGYAEKVKGATSNISAKNEELYAELKVNNSGYLEDGRITINAENFTWSTATVADSVVAQDYIGITSNIALRNKVDAGSQKLFSGSINAKIGNNIKDYSRVNTVTLTGTYVDNLGNKTPINVTREITVDWYGSVDSGIDTNNQVQQVLYTENTMTVVFDVITYEKNQQLKLKENNVIVKFPTLNGYTPNRAIAIDEDYEFNDSEGTITINRSSTIDEDGNVVKSLSNTNKYTIKVEYPIEARGYNEIGEPKNYTNIQIPVKSTYTGYNNQTSEFTPIVSSTKEAIIALVEAKETDGDILSTSKVTIGEASVASERYIISKEKAIQAYNNIETNQDKYEVMWEVRRENGTTNLTLRETKPDELLSTNAQTSTLSGIVKYDGIYFRGANAENIKIYNDETNELLVQYANATGTNEYNPFMYEESLNKVRVEIEKINNINEFRIYHIKHIDDEKMVNTYTKEQFDTFSGIYTYLNLASDDIAYTENSGYASYNELESQVKMNIANKNVKTQDLSTLQTIIIQTTANDTNQIKWKNGSFLVKYPSDVIYSDIESISVSDENVEILGYDLYKQNNEYYLKILTSNEDRTTYNITIRSNITLNSIATSKNDKYVLYAYNEDCNTYYWNTQDIYDVNNNNNYNENVGTYSAYMEITAPSQLVTSQTATNYDDEGTITIAPNIAEIDKQDRTADININVLNNYERTISEIKILGTIPFENNTNIDNSSELGSDFTSPMVSNGIQLPEGYNGQMSVYYTENPNATQDLEEATNGWTKTPQDFSKIRRYLIDFEKTAMSSGSVLTFKYTVKIPTNVDYNQYSFTQHKIFFAIQTSGGKLLTNVTSNKLGIRIVRKYGINILKVNEENNKVVPGAVFQFKEIDEEGNILSTKLVTTNSEGRLIANGLYINRKYILQEVKNPSKYSLNEEAIEFIVRENDNKDLRIEVLSENKFKTDPTIQNNTVYTTIVEHPRYILKITKRDRLTNEIIKNIRFTILPQKEQYITNKEGKIDIENLDQNKEYILKETYADGYYLLDDITFKLEKDGNKQFKICSNNNDFSNARITVPSDEDLIIVEVELQNDKQPSIIINKIDSETREPLKDIQIQVEDRITNIYKTDKNGQVTINGFEENTEYTIKEIKAEGYYLQNIKFKIVRDINNKLKVESENPAFANAVLIDETNKILSIVLPNEKKPTYDLKIVKTEENNYNKKLQGAKFQLIEEDTQIVREFETDENGEINIQNIYAYVEGKSNTESYILKEIKAPKGFSNNAEEIKFKVVKNILEDKLEIQISNQENLDTLANAEIKDGILNLTIEDKALFTLVKTDKETGKPLANAQFIIYELKLPIDYAKDINGDYVGTINEKGEYIVTTDENGTISLALKNGKYSIVEVGYPEGYKEEIVAEYFIVEAKTSEDSDNNNASSGSVTPAIQEPTTPEENDIIRINNIEDLVEISKQAENGNMFEQKTIILEKSLDFKENESYSNPNDKSYGDLNEDGTVEEIKEELSKGKGFTPIGVNYNYFKGTFDGNNKEIKNIYINTNGYAGLFACISEGTVKDFSISGEIYGTGSYATGAIVGYTEGGNYINCHNYAKIEGAYVGGIVGQCNGYNTKIVIENCTNEATLTSNYYGLGGIISLVNGSEISIKDCYNKGELIDNYQGNNMNIGGLLGAAYGRRTQIYNSYNEGIIKSNTTNSYRTIGGIVGQTNESEIINCYNNVDIMPVAGITTMGGIVGSGYGKIENCYNKGNLVHETLSSNDYPVVGGIIGSSSSASITNCYNTGMLKIENSKGRIRLGGILGNDEREASITNCYNEGLITVEGDSETNNNFIGGLKGFSKGTIENSYNKGNIVLRTSTTSYVGGLQGYQGTVKTSFNLGNIDVYENNSDSNPNIYVAGIGYSGNATDVYNSGNINAQGQYNLYLGGINSFYANVVNAYNTGTITGKIVNPIYDHSYIYLGGIVGSYGNANNSYNFGELIADTTQTPTTTVYKGDLVGDDNSQTQGEVEDIMSIDFYNKLNQNLVWAHINGYSPKLLINQAEIVDGTQINIKNNIKEYSITTEVEEIDGVKGGTITGEGEIPYEIVKHGESNAKEIIMIPEEEYAIEKIQINGEKIAFLVDENGQYKIPVGEFNNITQDIHIVVKFNTKDQVIPNKKVTVHHYFKQADGTLTTVKVAEDEEEMYKVGEKYATAPKIMLQYVELEKDAEGKYVIPENATGIMSTNDTIVTYYYEAKPIELTINHYITGTEQPLVEEEIIQMEGLPQIEDNKLVSVNKNQEYDVYENRNYKYLVTDKNFENNLITQDRLEIDKEKITFSTNSRLTYYYKLKDGVVKVKYVDQDTLEEINAQTLLTDNIGNSYIIDVKEIDGYEYVKADGDIEGKYNENEILVTLYYKKKAIPVIENTRVIVKYIDINNNKNLSSEIIEGEVGAEYTTYAKIIEGYELLESQLPKNRAGNMTKEVIEVTYYYKRKALVEIKYINKFSGEELAPKDIIQGLEGDEYTTQAKEIPYYNLLESPVNANGTMKVIETNGTEQVNNKTEVIYYYVAKDFNFSIEKTINKIIVNGVQQNIPNRKLAKIEIHKNSLDNTELIMEYQIKVSNLGELEGNATIVETIPSGFTVKQEDNKNWIIDGQTAKIKVEKLQAKETKTFTITLIWNKGEQNVGTKTNTVTIDELTNDAKFDDSDKENNTDSATLLLTIATGIVEDIFVETIYALLISSVAVFGIVVYKKIK